MKLKPRERVLLIILIVLIIGLLYYQFFLSGFLTQRAQVTAQSSEITQQLQLVNAKLDALPALEQEGLALKQQYELESQNVPPAVNEPDLMAFTARQVNDLGANYALTLQPTAPFADDTVIKAIQVTLNTNSENWLKILQRFADAPYKCRVLSAAGAVQPLEVVLETGEVVHAQYPLAVNFTVEYLAFSGAAQFSVPSGVTAPGDDALFAPAPVASPVITLPQGQ